MGAGAVLFARSYAALKSEDPLDLFPSGQKYQKIKKRAIGKLIAVTSATARTASAATVHQSTD
jgi:hypothetical protein